MKAADFQNGVYQVGQVVSAIQAKYETAKTAPPDRYTQSDLIDDMMGAYKFARDDREREVLRQIDGLGTSRTREPTITGLIDRGFVIEKKSRTERGRTELAPTDLARSIIGHLPDTLTSVGTTANWELAFRLIEQGKATPESARNYLRVMLEGVVVEAKGKGSIPMAAATPAPTTVSRHFGNGAVSGRAGAGVGATGSRKY